MVGMTAELQGVTFRYAPEIVALREVSITFPAGQAVAILGENGAGKTTLVRHLNGLLEPSLGRVLVGDWDTRHHSVAQLARRVGYVFQNPDEQLFARTIWDEVAFGARNLGQSGSGLEATVQGALNEVGLAELGHKHPYDLHAARRKLVAIAAALAMDTPILVLDEPTTGLDAAQASLVGRIVDRLRAGGRTVIAISHDVDFCAEHCSRVVVMSQGRILADGPAAAIFSQGTLLAQAEVEAPQLVRLAERLELAQRPLVVDDFIDALRARGRPSFSQGAFDDRDLG